MVNEERHLDLWENKNALILALGKIPFFDGLTEKEADVLVKYMSLYELAAGEILFKEGQVGQYVAFVVEGTMEVLKKTITGTDIVITTVGQGYAIGEMSMIDEAPRSATLRSRTESTLAILAQNAFKVILKNHPAMGIKILTGFARFQTENLRKTSNRLNAYTHLLATICNQKEAKANPNPGIDEKLAKEGASLIEETQSLSSLSTSSQFFNKLKKVLTTDLFK